MVSLSQIRASNSLISSTLPAGLVAVFVGATSGIGEITLKKFAKYTQRPRAYFIGRSQGAADRIVAECKTLNPSGEYIFRKADVSLICVVDEVCRDITDKEKALNLLFLSAGVLSMDRSKTSENVHLLASLNYYSRLRFIINLIPLIQNASSFRRVITVGGGSKEGPLDSSDFPALRVPLPELRGHLTTLITLGLEAVSKLAPDVSFVHGYPGTVETNLWRDMEGGPPEAMIDVRVPLDESGERHLYLATSAKFPSLEGKSAAVQLGDEVSIATGNDGEIGSGVYSVDWDCENASPAIQELLAGFRRKGVGHDVWMHTQSEFRRISELGWSARKGEE